jgi:hypothetical protein
MSNALSVTALKEHFEKLAASRMGVSCEGGLTRRLHKLLRVEVPKISRSLV